jgi:hypothetical protein
VFEDKLMKDPVELIYKTMTHLSNWKFLLTQKDGARLEENMGDMLEACGRVAGAGGVA